MRDQALGVRDIGKMAHAYCRFRHQALSCKNQNRQREHGHQRRLPASRVARGHSIFIHKTLAESRS